MKLARTIKETVHGNPGERRILPVNTTILVEPASNLPADNQIRYWVHPVPVEGHDWPNNTQEWAADVGVGLYAGDVELLGPL